MRKAQIIPLGFLGLALLDSLVTFGFPIDFTYIDYSFVPHFTFIGMIIYLNDKKWLNRLLIGTAVGLLFGILFTGTPVLDTILFAAGAYFIGLFNKYMQSDWQKFAWYMLFVFLFDLLPYIFMKLTSPDYPDLAVWFMHIEALTLVLDLVSVLFLLYIEQVMSRFFKIRELREQKAVKQRFRSFTK